MFHLGDVTVSGIAVPFLFYKEFVSSTFTLQSSPLLRLTLNESSDLRLSVILRNLS